LRISEYLRPAPRFYVCRGMDANTRSLITHLPRPVSEVSTTPTSGIDSRLASTSRNQQYEDTTMWCEIPRLVGYSACSAWTERVGLGISSPTHSKARQCGIKSFPKLVFVFISGVSIDSCSPNSTGESLSFPRAVRSLCLAQLSYILEDVLSFIRYVRWLERRCK